MFQYSWGQHGYTCWSMPTESEWSCYSASYLCLFILINSISDNNSKLQRFMGCHLLYAYVYKCEMINSKSFTYLPCCMALSQWAVWSLLSPSSFRIPYWYLLSSGNWGVYRHLCHRLTLNSRTDVLSVLED